MSLQLVDWSCWEISTHANITLEQGYIPTKYMNASHQKCSYRQNKDNGLCLFPYLLLKNESSRLSMKSNSTDSQSIYTIVKYKEHLCLQNKGTLFLFYQYFEIEHILFQLKTSKAYYKLQTKFTICYLEDFLQS